MQPKFTNLPADIVVPLMHHGHLPIGYDRPDRSSAKTLCSGSRQQAQDPARARLELDHHAAAYLPSKDAADLSLKAFQIHLGHEFRVGQRFVYSA